MSKAHKTSGSKLYSQFKVWAYTQLMICNTMRRLQKNIQFQEALICGLRIIDSWQNNFNWTRKPLEDKAIEPWALRSFICAGDLGIAAQSTHIDEVEVTLSSSLHNLTNYYKDNQLKANLVQTQVGLFHLRNRKAGRKLSLTWNGVHLRHCDYHVYLVVILDCALRGLCASPLC